MHLRKIMLLLLMPPIVVFAQQVKIPDHWPDGYVYAKSICIHYYHAIPGTGKPVIVMVHGAADNGLCWTGLRMNLQDKYYIYMLDSRGHGLTDPVYLRRYRETLMKDVVEFVKVMKFQKPILMGHSLGAATVMRIGADYPDIANAIVMLDHILKGR